MNRDYFHKKIIDTIEECSYNFYVVQPNKNISCTCTEHATKQPDTECKKCLGTGHKITIRRFRGACNDVLKGGASLGAESSKIIKNYFVNMKYPLHEDDLIIDGNEVFYVFRISHMKALKGVETHQEVTAVKKTIDHSKILNNFYNIIKTSVSNK